MTFMIDPAHQGTTSGTKTPPWLEPGRHVVWAADLTYKTTRKGDTSIEVLFCCVKGDHVGARMYERFILTQAASWKIARFARAVGHATSWDASNEEETRDILCSRPVMVTVCAWQNNKGEDRPQVERGQIDPFDGEVTDDMEKHVVAMEDYSVALKEHMSQKSAPNRGFGGPSDEVPF